MSLQPTCLSPALPCGEGKDASPGAGCMCSALQVEVTHLRGLVLQCLDDQKKLQQETIRLSAQLQRFCRRMEEMQQVRIHHLVAYMLRAHHAPADCGGCAEKTALNSYLYQSRIWWTKKDAYFLYEVLMQALIVAKQE